jgi:hypothetical protein
VFEKKGRRKPAFLRLSSIAAMQEPALFIFPSGWKALLLS